jgi:Fe-S-cluster containining protein
MHLPLRRTGLTRETPFSFACARCLNCCRHKRIQVNPYEVARLAANRGLDTCTFIERYTTNNGTFLNWDEQGACVFLSPAGCAVHGDRPLVCRLYPLGRHVRPDGGEHFSEIEPDAACRGTYGPGDVIGAYLDDQGTGPYIAAAGRYLDLFWQLCQALEERMQESGAQAAVAGVFQGAAGGRSTADTGLADLDAIVAVYCEKIGLPVPESLEEKMTLHIQAVNAWAHAQRGASDHEKIGKKQDRRTFVQS